MEEIRKEDWVELIGPYYGDPYGGHGRHTAAVGWNDLYVEQIIEGNTQSPYRIKQRSGSGSTGVGWAPRGSLILKGHPTK